MCKRGMMKWETLATHMNTSAIRIVLSDALVLCAHTTLRYALCDLQSPPPDSVTELEKNVQPCVFLVLFNVIIYKNLYCC